MENTSRALLIAGGVLIAIIILSMGVYLYILFSGQAKTYQSTVETVEMQKFNSAFEVYIGRTNITAQEVITAYNKAQEYRQMGLYVTVNVQGITIISPESFLSNFSDNTFSLSYSNVDYYKGRIDVLTFTKNSS